jgi:hypothetical protein
MLSIGALGALLQPLSHARLEATSQPHKIVTHLRWCV